MDLGELSIYAARYGSLSVSIDPEPPRNTSIVFQAPEIPRQNKVCFSMRSHV